MPSEVPLLYRRTIGIVRPLRLLFRNADRCEGRRGVRWRFLDGTANRDISLELTARSLVETACRLGEMIAEQKAAGGLAKRTRGQKLTRVTGTAVAEAPVSSTPTLPSVGVSHKQSVAFWRFRRGSARSNNAELRAEGRLGEMIAEQKATAGLNKGAKGKKVTAAGTEVVKDDTPTLASVGISHKQSARAQKLAKGTRGQLKGRKASGGTALVPPEAAAPTLADAGISTNLSSAAQKLPCRRRCRNRPTSPRGFSCTWSCRPSAPTAGPCSTARCWQRRTAPPPRSGNSPGAGFS
jgi:hypothetical protein